MMFTQVGRVTTRKGARLHVAINGWAACGAGHGRILGTPRDIQTGDAGHLCRRCHRMFSARLIMDLNQVSRRTDPGSRNLAAAIDLMLDEVDPFTNAELAKLAATADQLAREQIAVYS